jgi:hypothetical protein
MMMMMMMMMMVMMMDHQHPLAVPRSSCLGALGRWPESSADAAKSIELAPPQPPFTKGYFRLAKALVR